MKAWEKNVRTVVPYVPGEQPNQIGMIKLNTKDKGNTEQLQRDIGFGLWQIR